jgi:hypothetical protein
MLSIVFFLKERVPIAVPLPNVVTTNADGRLLWLADYITGCNKWLILTRLIIKNNHISIKEFPYKPSKCFPERNLDGTLIDCNISGFGRPSIRTNDGEILIFDFSKNDEEILKYYAFENHLPTIHYYDVWWDVLEPFIDTENTKDFKELITLRLASIGLTNPMVREIQEEIREMMIEYNFESGLWEWVYLGITDLLDACIGRLTHPAINHHIAA